VSKNSIKEKELRARQREDKGQGGKGKSEQSDYEGQKKGGDSYRGALLGVRGRAGLVGGV